MDSLKVNSPQQHGQAAATPSSSKDQLRASGRHSSASKEDATTLPPVVSRFRAAFSSHLPSVPSEPAPSSRGKAHLRYNGSAGGYRHKPAQTGAVDASAASTRTAWDDAQDSSVTASSSKPSRSGVGWADLLARIEETREGKYPALSTAHGQPTTAPQKAPVSSMHNLGESLPSGRGAHIDDSFQDRVFESQAKSRRYSLALQEEIRELVTPADALNWLQTRILNKTDENSLMSKIADPSSSSTPELHNLYGDLLVDISNFLRTSTVPHAAFLPLILAKAHSPASYLYGCTAKLYAVNIRTKWEVFGDIHGVLDLIQDMERGAVHLNPMIKDYVKNISMAVMADRMRAQRQVAAEEEEAARQLRTEQSESHSDEPPLQSSSEPDVQEAQPQRVDVPIKLWNDRRLESRLFFSTSQHRALREIERLVVQDQERYFEAKAREDHLHDSIISRYGGGGSANRYATWEDSNAAMSDEAEQISDVNALIGSYGKAVAGPPSGGSPRLQNTSGMLRDAAEPGGRRSRRIGGAVRSDAGNDNMQEASFDVLDEAVSEASKEIKVKKKPQAGTSSWSRKGKKSFGQSVSAVSASASKEVVQPRIVS